MLPLYEAITKSPRNDVWGTSEEIPHFFLPRSGKSFWLVEGNFPHCTTNQKHYPDLGCDMWHFCTCSLDLILWGTTGRVAKCRLFSQACFLCKVIKWISVVVVWSSEHAITSCTNYPLKCSNDLIFLCQSLIEIFKWHFTKNKLILQNDQSIIVAKNKILVCQRNIIKILCVFFLMVSLLTQKHWKILSSVVHSH